MPRPMDQDRRCQTVGGDARGWRCVIRAVGDEWWRRADALPDRKFQSIFLQVRDGKRKRLPTPRDPQLFVVANQIACFLDYNFTFVLEERQPRILCRIGNNGEQV